MKLSDYIAQNGDREIDSEKLDEVLQIKGNKVWMPKCGEVYWYLTGDGYISEFYWNRTKVDFGCWEIGNVFPTKEAAQAHVEHLKTRTALKRYAQAHNEREIDWDNPALNCTKFHIILNSRENEIRITEISVCKVVGEIYFTSEKIAQAAIEEIGEERIKQYLLYEG